MSTFAGELTSSLPRIIPELTSWANFSFFSTSAPDPRPIISTDFRADFLDSDLYLVSSNIPSIVPVIHPCNRENSVSNITKKTAHLSICYDQTQTSTRCNG